MRRDPDCLGLFLGLLGIAACFAGALTETTWVLGMGLVLLGWGLGRMR